MGIKIKILRPISGYEEGQKGIGYEIPYLGNIKAGFPSPAEDFVSETIDLNRYCVHNPAATFYASVSGTSMETEFSEGDLLVIDRSLSPQNGDIAVCFLEGEFTVKRIRLEKDHAELIPTNQDFPTLKVGDELEFLIWGIVTHVIKRYR